jgi:fructose-bisphosphate aldolase class I
MNVHDLTSTALALVAPGKGILAADESPPTIERRFKSIGLSSTEENRRAYRELLFTTAGVGEFISGVIMYDETLRQHASDGTPFTDVLVKQGIIPGIKVDKGTKPLAMCPGETITEGLDDLRARLITYRDLGARFAKWRAVITIGTGLPSHTAIHTNAVALGRYAALAQETGLVPIVEPEVLMDGDHTIERCYEATYTTLRAVFHELVEQRVILEGMLLKPNMVLSGKDCPQQASVQEVAEATVRCLLRTVPAAMPGVVFLSGGQSSEAATAHLHTMNTMAGPRPWQLSFSFARALQAPALQCWNGDAANVSIAQQAFYHRAKCNSLARYGRYSDAMEKDRGY